MIRDYTCPWREVCDPGLSRIFSYVLILGELQAEVAYVLILRGLLFTTRCRGGSGDGTIGGMDEFTAVRDSGGPAALSCCDDGMGSL